MNIEQIAQKVREEMSSAILPQVVGAYEEVFLRRCLEKLAEQNVEPAALVTQALGVAIGDPKEMPLGTKLYTETQLLDAQQRTAEACAKVCAKSDGVFIADVMNEILNGEWREYL